MRVWTCKIVVSDDAKLPMGFDYPPRIAAIDAVSKHADVLACSSGWGGTLTDGEARVMEETESGTDGVYVAGLRG